ncbi:MAG: type IV pilus assembly protein PilM, partial [Proteobacteria bacterium]|nr:type IV pilus assembly protein PilM [Pseudomonadota bacterium]
IGSFSVKAVEVMPRGNGFELLHLGVAALPHDAIVEGAFLNASAIADAIREAIAKSGSRAKHAAAAVSGHSVIVKKITVPAMTAAELEESIRWEAEQYIPFDVNEVNLDFEILQAGDAERPMEVLLVAAKKDLIDDYVNLIGEAGLTPSVIDVAGFAVENAFAANYGASDEVIAIVNIGAQSSTINVLAGGVPAFTRDVATGGNQYTAEIQRAMSVGFDEAERIKIGERGSESQDVVPQEVEQAMRAVTNNLVGEIARSLDFFAATAADMRIQRVYLAGGSSRVSGLEAAFKERTGLEVELMNPLAKMLPSNRFDAEFLDQVGPSLSVGIGLAMRRVDEP